MTFGASAGARAVLRTVVIAVSAAVTVLIRRITDSLWCLTPAVVAVFLLVWYLPRLTRSLYGEMDDRRITVQYGVLWQRETVVSLSSLRTFETWTPPLHRLFHCRTVVLRFAGGCAVLPLLDNDTAKHLTARLEEC